MLLTCIVRLEAEAEASATGRLGWRGGRRGAEHRCGFSMLLSEWRQRQQVPHQSRNTHLAESVRIGTATGSSAAGLKANENPAALAAPPLALIFATGLPLSSSSCSSSDDAGSAAGGGIGAADPRPATSCEPRVTSACYHWSGEPAHVARETHLAQAVLLRPSGGGVGLRGLDGAEDEHPLGL